MADEIRGRQCLLPAGSSNHVRDTRWAAPTIKAACGNPVSRCLVCLFPVFAADALQRRLSQLGLHLGYGRFSAMTSITEWPRRLRHAPIGIAGFVLVVTGSAQQRQGSASEIIDFLAYRSTRPGQNLVMVDFRKSQTTGESVRLSGRQSRTGSSPSHHEFLRRRVTLMVLKWQVRNWRAEAHRMLKHAPR